MKLNEIKPVITGTYNLSEGVIPAHIEMTLQQVVNDGKVTNSVQTYIIAGLVCMFKDGGPAQWPRDLNSYSMITNSDIIDAVKGFSDTESVDISTWLLQKLAIQASFESCPYAKPALGPQEWVRWVLSKQE